MKASIVIALLPLVAFAAGPKGAGNARGPGAQAAAGATSTTPACVAANTDCPAGAPSCGAAGPTGCCAAGCGGSGAAACDGMGPGGAGHRGPGAMRQRGSGACAVVASTTVTTMPAAQVVAGVEEERVAHDLYAAAAAKWQLRVFSRIAGCEIQHEKAFTTLASGASIAIAAAQPGTYSTSDLQTLYATLRPLVDQSDVSALRVGALVEETDIATLRARLGGELDSGTRTVLANLEAASHQHLLAFVRNLSARGVTYAPQVLTPEAYSTIVGSKS